MNRQSIGIAIIVVLAIALFIYLKKGALPKSNFLNFVGKKKSAEKGAMDEIDVLVNSIYMKQLENL